MSYEELYRRSLAEPESFWREQASEIAWFREPEAVLGQDSEGLDRWFLGGKLNTSYLALGRHVQQGRADQVALIYDSPVTQTQAFLTYGELHQQVRRLAGALRRQGVERGDTVVIYMPMIPQTVVAMLACAHLGAVHSVVFGGFAPQELAIRIEDARPKVILTASAGKEVDRVVDYQQIVRAALERSRHQPRSVVYYQRPIHPVSLRAGEVDWEELTASAEPVDHVELEATDPLYILYTSGTTGKPKGVLRDQGGHAVSLKFSMTHIYDAHPGEVFWAASDVGWVVGHSYIVYGPLIQGCTTVLYEGKPVRTPDAGAFWRLVAEHQVRVMFTAPTAIRAIKRDDPQGSLARTHDTSSLRYLFVAGERCDVATLQWAQQVLEIPVIDHWWQTESGWPMLANPAGTQLLPIRPGSAGKPVCGYDIRVLDAAGRELGDNQEGRIMVRTPLPPGCLPTLWHDTPRFRESYLAAVPGYYLTGDGGYRDPDGYYFITGRIDDVINVAGHRLSTSSMEEVLAGHPDVAECAVIGVEDSLKGHVPLGFVVVKSDSTLSEEQLRGELIQKVRADMGAVASFKRVIVVQRLPKTRSGKILRRTLRSMVAGEEVQVPATIEDPEVLRELAERLR